MNLSLLFFANSLLLGVGLAMDAFSVSIANGLNEHKMGLPRMCAIAGVYALFQFLMPMLGWVCVHTVVVYFSAFQKFIPWIALILLAYIGGKMLLEGIRGGEDSDEVVSLSVATLLLQGVATSIDALSVGFTIADYNAPMALLCSVLIAVVTFAICMGGLAIGKFGAKASATLAGKASILGGVILIAIGLEIFISNLF
jgi:putative Mn2+ efflux pump MntP